MARPSVCAPAPLLPTALGMIGGIVAAETGPHPPAAFVVLLAGLLLTVPRGPRRWGVVVGAALLIGVACGVIRTEQSRALPGDHIARCVGDAPTLVRIAGVIRTMPGVRPAARRNRLLPYDPEPTTRFVFECRQVNGVPGCGLVQVDVRSALPELRPGAAIRLTGWLRRPHGPSNPGAFDAAAWLASRGIHATLQVPDLALIEPARPPDDWQAIAPLLRGYAADLLGRYRLEDRPQRLLATMVLGQRSRAGAELNDAFARTGSLHYLAVSGFHVGILLAVTWWTLRGLLRIGQQAAALLSIIVLCGYALIAEPNPPIVRATLLGVFWCLGRVLGRGASPRNWLAAAALAILWQRPAALWQPGFQLSFVQVAMLLCLADRLRLTWGDPSGWLAAIAAAVLRTALGLLIVAAASWLTAVPLVAHHFERVAPWGPLASAAIAPLVMLTLVLGLIALPLAHWSGTLALLDPPLRWASSALLTLVEWLGATDHSLVAVSPPPAFTVLTLYAAGAAIVWPMPLHLRTRVTVAVLLVAVSISFALPGRGPDGRQLCVLSVGAGNAVLLGDAARSHLFDVGTRSNFDSGLTVETALRSLHLPPPDDVFISHANLDHYSGLASLLERIGEARVYGNPTFAARPDVLPLVRGDEVSGVAVLWPPPDLPEWVPENDRSLVLHVDLDGFAVLIPGDIEGLGQAGLLEAAERGEVDLHSDILVAPHHGSVLPPETRAFYAAVAPRIVIASSDRPRPELRALLNSIDPAIELYVTDEVGAVGVAVERGAVRISTCGR